MKGSTWMMGLTLDLKAMHPTLPEDNAWLDFVPKFGGDVDDGGGWRGSAGVAGKYCRIMAGKDERRRIVIERERMKMRLG
ncbi:hypothetical protein Tco_0541130 [Tanacetum coccineum]